jgi:hypothetical protein
MRCSAGLDLHACSYELASCLKGVAGSQICHNGATMLDCLAPLLATNHLASAAVIRGWDTIDVTFIKMLTEEGVQIVNAQQDCEGHHGTNGMDDGTIEHVQLAMKRVMHDTSLPPKFWPKTLDAVTLLMNHLPNARNKSQDENARRPIEALSAGIVSTRYCNHVLFYFCNPGMPAYCSTPYGTKDAYVRPAVRMGQTGTQPTWMLIRSIPIRCRLICRLWHQHPLQR